MSAIQPPNKISHRHELREDQVITTYARAWGYYDTHKTVVYGVLGALVVLALAVVGWMYYKEAQGEKALVAMAPAVRAYEQGNFREALDGPQGSPGLMAIADDYSGTPSGNLAAYYAADASYRLGEYDQALRFFDDYDADENILGASALAGEAAAYEAKGDFARAAERYMDAADFLESELTAPQYLFSAARAFEQAGRYDRAVEVYTTLRDDYPESNLTANIDFFVARAEAREQAGS